MELKKFSVNGIGMVVREQGQGRPILLIHGFPFDHSMWNRLFDAMYSASVSGSVPSGTTHSRGGGSPRQSNERGLHLIAPDLRGLGASGLPEGAELTTMEQFADDLHALLAAMDIREEIILCGLSMGGYVAMQYMKKFPENVAKIVLSNTKTTADPPQIAENRRQQAENLRNLPRFLRSVADTMIPNVFAAKTLADRPDVVQEMQNIIEANNPFGAAAATRGMAARPDTTELLAALDIPVLVLCGSEDKFSPPEEMERMSLQAKKGQYLVFSEAGHVPPMEQPTQFADALCDFCLS